MNGITHVEDSAEHGAEDVFDVFTGARCRATQAQAECRIRDFEKVFFKGYVG